MFGIIITKNEEYSAVKNLFAVAKTHDNNVSFIAYFEFFQLKAFYVNPSYWIKGEIKDGGSNLDIFGENEKSSQFCIDNLREFVPSFFVDVTKEIFVHWKNKNDKNN